MSFARVSAFVHRASILVIALAAGAALVAESYGANFGLTTEQVLAITAASVAISTIARSLTAFFDHTSEVFREQISVLREAATQFERRGDVTPGVAEAVVGRTVELEEEVKNASF